MEANQLLIAPEPKQRKRKTIDAEKAIKSKSTGTDAQFDRLVALLRNGPQTTYALRKHGIAQTSSRIWDLRARGYNILTELVDAYDSDGYLHVRVARYSLLAEPEAANDE
jgi:DNA-directed RNA polymerase specialized sigma54-like protein